MRRVRKPIIAALVGVVALASAAVFAMGPRSDVGQAADRPMAGAALAGELVRQLGDDSYRVRRQATQRLTELGLAAKMALVDGLHDPDAEIRTRSQRILSVVLELDQKARLAAFAADPEGKSGHDLPGWDRFRRIAGEDAVARELFVEIQRAEPELCEAAETGPELVGAMLQARCEHLQQQRAFGADGRSRRGVSLGSIATIFFIASNPEVTVGDPLVSYLPTFSYQQSFQEAITRSEKAASLKKLLGAWITRPTGSINSYQNFVLALQFDLREGLAPAAALLHDGGAQPHVAQYALLLVGKFGGKADLPLVLPLLADEMLLGSYTINEQEVRTEVRDVALAVLVHLTAQDYAQYGFEHLQRNPMTLFQPVTAGFTTPQKREAALAKWHAWVASQPKEAFAPEPKSD